MACTVLEACGRYIDKASNRKRMDVFLLYLTRYCFCKQITVDVQFALDDMLQVARMMPSHIQWPAHFVALLDRRCDRTRSVRHPTPRLARSSRSWRPRAARRSHARTNPRTLKDGATSARTHPVPCDPQQAIAHKLLRKGDGGDGAAGPADELSDDDDAPARDRPGDEGGGDEGGGDEGVDEAGAEEEEVDGLEDRRREVDDDADCAALGAQPRREATREEQDAFDKEMAAVRANMAKPRGAADTPKPLPGAKVPAGLLHGGGGGTGGSASTQQEGTMTLRVLASRRAPKGNTQLPQLHVPLEDKLARTVLKMDAQATEERERLKQQILGAASASEEKARYNEARTERRW